MRCLAVITLLLSAFAGQSQVLNNPEVLLGSRGLYGASVEGSLGYASPTLTNAFLGELLGGAYMSREVSERQLDRLSQHANRFGGDYVTQIRVYSTMPSQERRIGLIVSDESHLDVRFDEAAARLGLTGNKSYAGTTAEIGQLDVRFLRFQRIGLEYDVFRSATGSVTFGASYVNGQGLQMVHLERGDVYTSEIGDTIRVDAIGSAFLSDTSSTGFMAKNGSGAAFDVRAQMFFDAGSSNWQASAMLRNLGMIQWRSSPLSYDVDTIYQFTGIEVVDIKSISTGSGSNLEDTLTNEFLIHRPARIPNTLLPSWVQLYVSRVTDQGLLLGFGMNQRWNANYATYGWVDAGYQFGFGLGVQGRLAYGGYGTVQTGVTLTYAWRGLSLYVQQNNLEALIAPEAFGGFTSSAGIHYAFGK